MAFLQDLYPDDYAHCHGCGRLNTHGLHVKSEWHDGEAAEALERVALVLEKHVPSEAGLGGGSSDA